MLIMSQKRDIYLIFGHLNFVYIFLSTKQWKRWRESIKAEQEIEFGITNQEQKKSARNKDVLCVVGKQKLWMKITCHYSIHNSTSPEPITNNKRSLISLRIPPTKNNSMTEWHSFPNFYLCHCLCFFLYHVPFHFRQTFSFNWP